MKIPNWSKALFLTTVDAAMSAVPRSPPPVERMRSAKVVSHRNRTSHGVDKENTLASLETAAASGAWAVEFDVRWSTDGVPVVHHDPDAKRVFADDLKIRESKWREIRSRLPLVPSFEEALAKLKGRTHLMIELKRDGRSFDRTRRDTLRELLSSFEPIVDYHIMSLDLSILLACDFVPRAALLPIAELNIEKMSRAAIEHRFGGITGQYALVPRRIVQRHRDAGQIVGTGFVESKSILYREVGRGVDWLFSNRPAEMVSVLAQASAIPSGM